jgi:GNAT superfamily N-acetyltransferase
MKLTVRPLTPRSVACVGRPVWQERRMQWMLVHVLAGGRSLAKTSRRSEQSRVSRDRQTRSAARVDRIRWRQGRGLVPAYPTRCPAVARSPVAAKAHRRNAGLVPLLFYVPKGHCRKGVTAALIAAALKAAKRAKAPALEAYPLDADKTPSASGTAYRTTFAGAGFRTVARHVPPRPIMRHDLRTIAR